MTEKIIKNESNFAQNTAFTDTGSAKTQNSGSNSQQISESSPIFGKNQENSRKTGSFEPNMAIFQGNSVISSQNAAVLSENEAVLQGKASFLNGDSDISQGNTSISSGNSDVLQGNTAKMTENSATLQEITGISNKNATFQGESTEKSPKSNMEQAIFENNTDNPYKNSINEAKSDIPPYLTAISPRDFFTEASSRSFSRDFPDVDLNKLKNSREFCAFLDILTKNPTLSQVYACFNSISKAAEESSEKKLLQALANANASVGSLSSSQAGERPFFTKEQVLKMSPSQIKENFTLIRKSQENW